MRTAKEVRDSYLRRQEAGESKIQKASQDLAGKISDEVYSSGKLELIFSYRRIKRLLKKRGASEYELKKYLEHQLGFEVKEPLLLNRYFLGMIPWKKKVWAVKAPPKEKW